MSTTPAPANIPSQEKDYYRNLYSGEQVFRRRNWRLTLFYGKGWIRRSW